jgi:hypothetical protein
MDSLRPSISALPGKESKDFLIPDISAGNMLLASCRLSGSGTDLHVSNNLAPLPILATCLLQYLLKYLLFRNYVTIDFIILIRLQSFILLELRFLQFRVVRYRNIILSVVLYECETWSVTNVEGGT